MKKLKDLLHLVEKDFDSLKLAIRMRKGYKKGIQLISHHGYGNGEKLNVHGRLLRNRDIPETSNDDSVFVNIERMYKHFNSKELPGITIQAHYNDSVFETVTDEEGYYHFEIPKSNQPNDNQLWHDVNLTADIGKDVTASQIGKVQIPVKETQLAVISDIDDTILQSGAHSLKQMIKTTFTKNAASRLTFSGVNHLYHGFQNGGFDRPVNPIFYLSNSPWNLFDFLDDFMELKGIPKGSVLLRDWGLDENKTLVDDTHKLTSIAKLLNNYPELSFILIGDSGEKDPEYYQEIVKKFPGRILAVYIRNVTEEPRNSEVLEIASEIESLGVPMLLVKDSLVAAEHAFSKGWIKDEVVTKIKAEIIST